MASLYKAALKKTLQKAAAQAKKEAEELAAKAATIAEAEAAAIAMADAQRKEAEATKAAAAAAASLFNQEIINQAQLYAAEAIVSQQQADNQEEAEYWKNQTATYLDIAEKTKSEDNRKYVILAGVGILALLLSRR